MNEQAQFRNSIATVDKSGKRIWLYPKNPLGKLTTYRNSLAVLLLAVMFSVPFIKVNGEPLLLLNIMERKFVILGKIFWPQDFHIFLLIMLAAMIFIVLFTVVFGRVFCGYICPQTIFMESVFRKIEYWIEGDWKTRMALDKAPLSAGKVWKKSAKHFIFFVVSFAIANVFLSYIIGADEVLQIWKEDVEKNKGTITSLLVFTGIFYWVYAKFREQVCTTVCPYGRLQGVFTDKNTLLVAYDYVRGERRAKFKKNENRPAKGYGDCIDCYQCVNVCPVGIDIRNGTQMECINCAACIDACNFMMSKVGLEQGLIRFDSEYGIAEKKPFRFTWRIAGYSMVLSCLVVLIGCLLVFRTDVETSVLRTPGVMFQVLPDSKISNLYNIKLVNKTNKEIPIQLRLLSGEGEIKLIGNGLVLPAQGSTQTSAFIILDQKKIKQVKTKLLLGVYDADRELETVTTTFIGPLNN